MARDDLFGARAMPTHHAILDRNLLDERMRAHCLYKLCAPMEKRKTFTLRWRYCLGVGAKNTEENLVK